MIHFVIGSVVRGESRPAPALGTGVDTTWTQESLLPQGVSAPNTGGTLVSLTYGVIASLRTDLLLRFLIQTPVYQRWNGSQRESPTGILSFTVDL